MLASTTAVDVPVPDSNPDEIAILWKQVCPPRATPKQSSEGSSLSNAQPFTVTPRSSNFSEAILKPRGILFNDKPWMISAFEHFGTKAPRESYRNLEGLDHANIWVEKSSTEVTCIAAEFKEMRDLGLGGEEYATLAKEIFLLRERRSANVSPDRRWRVERMLQLACPPVENGHWRVPPILNSNAARNFEAKWSWDIRPDCTYWLSLKGFNQEYRCQIPNCAFVQDYITCPYFTVEFKQDGQSESVTERRVAAAGSLALFNRWYLYSEACKANPSLPDNTPHIRHYALTYLGPKFVFWIIQPTLKGSQWDGCTITRLFGADCTDEFGVRQLIDWINEIHRWGLSEYGPRCEGDMRAILKIENLLLEETRIT
ncbi:hypothetical protein F5B18DRAFT_627448 [Nemania serpens]|nr:hypothetical protein F5B18DRAFT_627448 [Nemania serpens]